MSAAAAVRLRAEEFRTDDLDIEGPEILNHGAIAPDTDTTFEAS